MARLSSRFFRLERTLNDGCVQVVEFHSVVNGNRYYADHEEDEKGRTGYIGKIHHCSKEAGNRHYEWLKSLGYKFAGKYEMDIYGHKTPVKGGA